MTLIYFPIAHMVWYWAGPDAIGDAAKALAAATDDAAKAAAQAKLDAVNARRRLALPAGALDFAGGTVVHINAGIAGLVGALIIGKRIGYGKEAVPPHSLTMTMIGASLLWVGWFGFNAGSNLEANGTTALAFVNTMRRHCRRGAVLAVRRMGGQGQALAARPDLGRGRGPRRRHAGFGLRRPDGLDRARPDGLADLLVLRRHVKSKFGYDDALDVFGVHCIGGITGALMTGILVHPALGGVGITDYTNSPRQCRRPTISLAQMIIQAKAVGTTLLWSGIGSAILYKVVDLIVGLRPKPDGEREGLDITDHGERAYNP